ncbi:hypothetical protein E2C01_084398 [Portunus trituberculatus]|uniref:Uncharacterized protein n=1 Tax=Portunus trituberculatus TaxID=210409 RepID=A0A5B7IY61_PORTR|nr:hypothetical protein [Portunus trituberculatus]
MGEGKGWRGGDRVRGNKTLSTFTTTFLTETYPPGLYFTPGTLHHLTPKHPHPTSSEYMSDCTKNLCSRDLPGTHPGH